MIQVIHRKQKRSAVVGMILGDAHIRKQGNLTITHCLTQKPYLEFKCDILQKNQKAQLKVVEFDNNGYPGCKLETRIRPIYKVARKRLYKNNVKTINDKILRYLDELGIAIWFQDDGSTTAKKRNGKIHAYEITLNTYLSKEQNELIVQYFKERWDISWGLSKSKGKYRLRMGTKEGRKFAKLIQPYIVPCMNYKIESLV